MSQPKLCGTSHVIPSRSYALAATVHPVRHDGITISGAPCRLAAARRPVARRFLCRRREREERSSSARASTTWDVPPWPATNIGTRSRPWRFGLGCSQIYYPIPTPVPTPAESPPTPLCEPRLRAPTGAVPLADPQLRHLCRATVPQRLPGCFSGSPRDRIKHCARGIAILRR